jgi:hypothetical protein
VSILDRIDDTLDDWRGSQDAMRWTPGAEGEPDDAGGRNPTYLELMEQQHAAMLQRQQEWWDRAQRVVADQPQYDPGPELMTPQEAFAAAMRRLSDGYGVPVDELLNPGGWRGQSASYWIVDEAQITLNDLTPYLTQPQGDALLRPAIEPDTMRQIIDVAAETPQFEPPARRPVTMSWAPAGTDPRDDGAFTSLDDSFMVRFTVDASPAMAAMRLAQEAASHLAETMNRAAQANRDARLTQERRYAWSGPTRYERQIARAFGLTIDQLFPKTPSALDARYHRRYRNRMGRR